MCIAPDSKALYCYAPNKEYECTKHKEQALAYHTRLTLTKTPHQSARHRMKVHGELRASMPARQVSPVPRAHCANHAASAQLVMERANHVPRARCTAARETLPVHETLPVQKTRHDLARKRFARIHASIPFKKSTHPFPNRVRALVNSLINQHIRIISIA